MIQNKKLQRRKGAPGSRAACQVCGRGWLTSAPCHLWPPGACELLASSSHLLHVTSERPLLMGLPPMGTCTPEGPCLPPSHVGWESRCKVGSWRRPELVGTVAPPGLGPHMPAHPPINRGRRVRPRLERCTASARGVLRGQRGGAPAEGARDVALGWAHQQYNPRAEAGLHLVRAKGLHHPPRVPRAAALRP